MKLLSIRLENYIGIYNGRGDNILEVDLSQSTSNIVIIRGSNGSGKSTLLKALSPLQDDNTAIIPGLEGKKTLRYLYNGELYEILYVHPVKNDGSRGQVKMQVYKGMNRVELNPTWNVTSGKDIIFDLFNLDANFLTLSQLSSEDRGLADKKPAERKKFVNSIINGIEVYNNMYKIITKKYSTFKNMINTISSKIRQIGNIEELNARFINISKQVEDISSERDKAVIEASKIDAEIGILTRDNNLEEYYKINEEIRDNIDYISASKSQVIDLSKGELSSESITELKDIIDSSLQSFDKDISKWKSEEAVANAKIESISREKDDTFKSLQTKITKRGTLLDGGFSDSDLSLYKDTKDKIAELENDINSLNSSIKNLSEAEALVNAMEMIVPVLDSLYNGLDATTKKEKYDFVKTTLDADGKYVDQTVELSRTYNEVSKTVGELESEILAYEILFDKAKSLALRPKECKIDDCSFVKEAIEASSKHPEKRINDINKEINESKTLLKSLEKDIESYKELYDFNKRFTNLHGMVLSFRKLLEKSPVDYIIDPYQLLASLDHMEKLMIDFNQIRGIFNIITTKSNYEEIIESLKEPAAKYEANKALIDELDSDIASLKDKLNTIDNRLMAEKDAISETVTDIALTGFKIEVYTKCKSLVDECIGLEARNEELQAQINSLSDIAFKVKNLEGRMAEAKSRADRLNNDLNAILNERDKIASNKTLLEDYIRDLELYNKNFSILETIRYYLSPTTGIQTVFMRTYMGNIILKANELLSLIFNGQFIIQPFVINEAEFRIPCLGNGLVNDDISSMSTSQICMISMILSFAILSNSSTDYNILKLDEIDGGLDTENRIQFIGLLKQLISMVGCEQCFLISHNMEYDADTTVIDMAARPVLVR
jgi:DNA repair exonuclease SbcCD ATPase subunit|nr:MAG TPA: STRUCTURAL MAINTENANCE OF CHROMOSOMES PROTEIN [Caudoviricetes sp.]